MNSEYIDPSSIHELFKRPELWAKAAELLRAKIENAGFTQKDVQNKLGFSQPSVSRFMNGAPTRTSFQKQPQKLVELLAELGMTLDDLQKNVQSPLLWLCIDRIEEDSNDPHSVIECPTLMFRSAGDEVEAIPAGPNLHDGKYCRYCGTELSSSCPYCRAPVVAGSYCPECGGIYVAGLPRELRGLSGRELAIASEKRNQANRQVREHVES